MKILAIGDSFTQDAMRYLQPIAKAGGFQAETLLLYNDGAPLMRHVKNIREKKPVYRCDRNGNESTQYQSISDALSSDAWDVVVLQQCDAEYGVGKSWQGHLEFLADTVRALCPAAKLYIHELWSCDHFAQNPEFRPYGKDSDKMYTAYRKCAEAAASAVGGDVIPVGKVLQGMRQRPRFDLLSGGISLCRDGWHLMIDYGRFLAAAVWYETLFRGDIRENGYKLPVKDPDMAVLGEIKAVVHELCRK